MKAGDPIMIKVGDNWRHGLFLGERVDNGNVIYNVGIGEPHYFNYEEKEVDYYSVKKFIRLSEEEAMAKHQAELPQAFKLAEEALAKLLPNEEIKISDGSILGYNGAVMLDPVVYENFLIDAVEETAGWQVNVGYYYYATLDQPEECDLVEVGTSSNWQESVRLFIETIFKQKFYNYWESQGNSQLCFHEE